MFLSSKINTSVKMNLLSVYGTENFSSAEDILMLVQSGSLQARMENRVFTLHAHDILRIPPGCGIALSSSEQNQSVLFTFDADFLDRFIPPGYRLVIDSAAAENPATYSVLEHHLKKLMFCCENPSEKYILLSILYQILYELSQRYLFPVVSEDGDSSADYTAIRIRQINEYLENNCHLPIHLQDLAESMYLTPQYVSRFIRSEMKTSFKDLLNNKRIRNACIELAGNDSSITEVAFNSGFSSMSTFGRQFQAQTGMTPAAWRREHSRKSAPVPDSENQIFPVVQNERENETVIPVSYSGPVSYEPCWQDTINIGMLTNMLSETYAEELRGFRKALGFSYVRFYNLFADEILPAPIPGESLNFSTLDMIFDSFIEMRVHPFIELSFKPNKIALFPTAASTAVDLFGEELPLSEKLTYLRALLGHVIRRYGYEEVSAWRFEIWAKHNEALTYLETPQEYLEKYTAYLRVIREFLPDAMVGGPGFNTASAPSGFTSFLKAFRESGIRPDFFSIYVYSYDENLIEAHHPDLPDSHIHFLTMDPDYLLHTFQSLTDAVRGTFSEEIPLFVTEFNSSLNWLDFVSSSAFQAAYLVRNMLALTQHTKCLAYWHLSDRTTEPVADSRMFGPGLGLLSRNGVPKPSCFAMQLLGSLEHRCALIRENCIAATNGFSRYQFLICHYHHYNVNYSTGYLSHPSPEKTYEMFDEAETKSFRIELSGLTPGIYSIHRTTIGRKNGSFLDQLLHIFSKSRFSIREMDDVFSNASIRELAQCTGSSPLQEHAYKETEDGTFLFHLLLDPHDVILLDLKKCGL